MAKLIPKTVHELLNLSFYIPSYQRGYRWTKTQVEELLKDIWEFSKNSEKEEFYCLQPLVVKQRSENEWEVIDGQQRLTTSYLILTYFNRRLAVSFQKALYSLAYQTRPDSAIYLKELNEHDREKNIDYHFIYQAFQTIESWFNDKQNIVNDFESTLLNRVKFIWYEIETKVSSIDIFTRLNVGKIPLTNAELIRALFLQSGNFQDEYADSARLKQHQIASEWDKIEFTLQNSSFWHFIYTGNKKYDTRIERIFDLMKGKDDDDEDEFYTFHQFSKDFEANSDFGQHWKKIKDYFMTFEEWYHDHELYHLIGYLIATGVDVAKLKEDTQSHTKTAFKEELRKMIGAKVNHPISELEYGDSRVKPLLLLFNIQTILSNPKSNLRFPFDSYKTEDWDIEHIRSVKSDKPMGKDRRLWLKDVLHYFTGKKEIEEQFIIVEGLPDNEDKAISKLIVSLLSEAKIPESSFNPIYDRVLLHFGEETEPENINQISNLALLDSSTNRGYKNAVFPIKRKTIIRNDKHGTFVPICTKNVFLKLYSKKAKDLMFWQPNDAADYLKELEATIKPFITTQNSL